MGVVVRRTQPYKKNAPMRTPSPRYLLPGTVYDAARERVRWIIREFDGKLTVSTSGGKDSAVIMELAVEVAREEGCLPVTAMWLDQECEFASTVEYQRYLADRPEIDFRWYQIPFNLFNATNHDDPWLHVWGEGEEWVREKEVDSIHVNTLGVDRFKEVLHAINREIGGAFLIGMRAEESLSRQRLLTSHPSYKWVTWSARANPRDPDGSSPYWLFYPIYDWGYRDVWKSIHDHGWVYNTHYDRLFQYGIPIHRMRVSNYHHETALYSLFLLQEVEPETWERATKRLTGISSAGHVGFKDWHPTELPYMFGSWWEYSQYLITNLISAPASQEIYRKRADGLVKSLYWVDREKIARHMVREVITNDLYGTTTETFKLEVSKWAIKSAGMAAWEKAQATKAAEQEEAFAGDLA